MLNRLSIKSETKETVKNTFRESFLILVYECVGTAMLTTLIANYYAIRTLTKKPYD